MLLKLSMADYDSTRRCDKNIMFVSKQDVSGWYKGIGAVRIMSRSATQSEDAALPAHFLFGMPERICIRFVSILCNPC